MARPALSRVLMLAAALAAAPLLAGCNTEGLTAAQLEKAQKPLPPDLVKTIADRQMDVGSPILVRIFKEDSELEVWKQGRDGRFALLKTYPICRWSGELGPKVKEGDRQAPEGFYSITPAQMNPQSAYYLSFNIGYPNAFDKSLGRTGSQLMVHGDCSSRGCYAMTDDQIGEIYALARESFFGGQRAFQIQAYPFRMTPKNMARHRSNPNMAFWRMLKEGYDHFEVSRLEPKVNVCDRRYVFDAQSPANSTKALNFVPTAACPAYDVPDDILAAVREKQERDNQQIAALTPTTPVAPIRTNTDGGMNPVFAAKIAPTQRFDSDGRVFALAPEESAAEAARLSSNLNPPKEARPVYANTAEGIAAARTAQAATAPSAAVLASAAPVMASTRPAPAPAAAPAAKPGLLTRMANFVGLRGSSGETKPAAAPKPTTVATVAPTATPKPAPRSEVRAAEPAKPKPAAAAAEASASAAPAQMSGSQPIVQSSSFDSRFGGAR